MYPVASCVPAMHCASLQALLFTLCALCPKELCRVRVGPLTPHAIGALRDMRDILGIQFDIKPEYSSKTVVLSCIGTGYRNLNRAVS